MQTETQQTETQQSEAAGVPINVHVKLIGGEEFVCQVPCIEYLTDGAGFVTLDNRVCRVVYTHNKETGVRNMSLHPLSEEHPPDDPITVYKERVVISKAAIACVYTLTGLGALCKYFLQKTSSLVLVRGH
jgi:hypothetical protein